MDALRISAAKATTATEDRIHASQSSTENATRAAVSELQRLKDELSKCCALLNRVAHFLNQQQFLNLQQPFNQQPLFQHSQLQPQHPNPQPPSASCPPHAPSNNQLPQHFPPHQGPLQAPPFDPSMNQIIPMNSMNPHGRRDERLRKLFGLFSGKPGYGEFRTRKKDLTRAFILSDINWPPDQVTARPFILHGDGIRFITA